MAKEPDLKSGEAERCLGSSPSPSAITYQGQEPFAKKGAFWVFNGLSPFCRHSPFLELLKCFQCPPEGLGWRMYASNFYLCPLLPGVY